MAVDREALARWVEALATLGDAEDAQVQLEGEVAELRREVVALDGWSFERVLLGLRGRYADEREARGRAAMEAGMRAMEHARRISELELAAAALEPEVESGGEAAWSEATFAVSLVPEALEAWERALDAARDAVRLERTADPGVAGARVALGKAFAAAEAYATGDRAAWLATLATVDAENALSAMWLGDGAVRGMRVATAHLRSCRLQARGPGFWRELHRAVAGRTGGTEASDALERTVGLVWSSTLDIDRLTSLRNVVATLTTRIYVGADTSDTDLQALLDRRRAAIASYSVLAEGLALPAIDPGALDRVERALGLPRAHPERKLWGMEGVRPDRERAQQAVDDLLGEARTAGRALEALAVRPPLGLERMQQNLRAAVWRLRDSVGLGRGSVTG
ncbi:MAG: hypothetical protein H6736_11775 [Alphaproteobacteria bacterium]|nr:hypothetical protein [Alphaproteobacteria bacterium]MCB9692482.1 hypothetical protein [Alphaproteobacteria bacterium]